MKIRVVHSPQQRCGVREYGMQLDRALQGQGVEVEPFTYNDLGTAFDGATANQVVLVHFEAGLADPTRLSFYGRASKARGVKTVFCCHWYEDNYMRENYQGVADKFVVHRHYGTMLPISIIPLGCPVYEPSAPRSELRAKFGYGDQDVVLTTIGFLATWKRLPDVAKGMMDQLAVLWPSGLAMKIHFQTPWPFYAGDAAVHESDIRRTMANHQSGSRMKLSTEFLSEQDALDLAHASDVGFVFHGIHTHSVSAATKQFVSARTPLVVTNSSHSSDIDGVEKVDTFDMMTFCRAVTGLGFDADKRANMRERMAREYERLNMNAVAGRYVDLFKELGAS